MDSGQVYTPTAWSAEQARQLLRSVQTLEECGLSVRVPDWWSKRPRPQVNVTVGEKKRTALDAQSMLDFSVGVALGDFELTLEEIRELLSSQDGLVMFKGKWVEVDRDKLNQALEDHLAGIFGRRGLVLHGSTQVKKRQALVEQFQDDDGPPFFILTLKTGGTGLNLTAASHVIHLHQNRPVERRHLGWDQKKELRAHWFLA